MFSWKLKGHDFSTTGDLKGQGGDGRTKAICGNGSAGRPAPAYVFTWNLLFSVVFKLQIKV
jgi:hypothetical protein